MQDRKIANIFYSGGGAKGGTKKKEQKKAAKTGFDDPSSNGFRALACRGGSRRFAQSRLLMSTPIFGMQASSSPDPYCPVYAPQEGTKSGEKMFFYNFLRVFVIFFLYFNLQIISVCLYTTYSYSKSCWYMFSRIMYDTCRKTCVCTYKQPKQQ